MFFRPGESLHALCLFTVLAGDTVASGFSLASWRGVVRDDAGKPVGTATLKLTSVSGGLHYLTSTSAGGGFAFPEIVAGEYELSVESGGKRWASAKPITLKDGTALSSALQLL